MGNKKGLDGFDGYLPMKEEKEMKWIQVRIWLAPSWKTA